GRWLVDLPGYGYARAPVAERLRWQTMVERYLTGRPTLTRVLVLIDGEIGPTPLDLQLLDWLAAIGVTPVLVATKSDKVRPSRRPARKTELAERLGVAKGDVTWVSADKGHGIDELRAQIMRLLTEPAQES
ncbi:MAG TPA: GTP-binding protein 8, partial [Acidimicrobiales bacterium]